MGRKSNRKKTSKIFFKERKKIEEKENLISCLILIFGLTLFVIGDKLYDKTFISNWTKILLTLIGTIFGFLLLKYFWKNKNLTLIPTLFLSVFLGGSIPFCITATSNFYFKDTKQEKVVLNIDWIGTHQGRYGKCPKPYGKVEFENISKEVKFSCDYASVYRRYKKVEFIIVKGFWGYPIFVESSLIE